MSNINHKYTILTLTLAILTSIAFYSPIKSNTISLLSGYTSNQPILSKQLNYVPGEVLIKFKEPYVDLDYGQSAKLATSYSLEYKETTDRLNYGVLKITDDKSVEETITLLNNDPRVEYAEPNYIMQPAALGTNDTYADQLWGLDNTGQTINGEAGTADADIDMPEAWALSLGDNAPVIIAIIDDGVAYTLPDLAGNMWDGTSCVDETGAVLGGCIHGYDYGSGDLDPYPLTSFSTHGTHIAGTIGAARNNTNGITGIAPNVQIMALNVETPIIGMTTGAIIDAIHFAIQNDAKVINASFGGSTESALLYDAIEAFQTSGGIFVAAAGNGGTDGIGDDNDVVGVDSPMYPASSDLPNIIAVAATDYDDHLTSFSNYGATSVDVGAPGEEILSTVTMQENYLFNPITITPPNLPAGWTDSGTNWITVSDAVNGNYLIADASDIGNSYLSSANNVITSSVIDTSNQSENPILYVGLDCETENTDPTGGDSDYLMIEVSPDGTAWTEATRLNTNTLSDPYYAVALDVSLQTNAFQVRYTWVSNATDNNYFGCRIFTTAIILLSDGTNELYAYFPGTSMATPHVSGLAAYLWGYNGTLSAQEVMDAIKNEGDTLSDLTGKTTTGKRINAYNSLVSLGNDCIPVATPVGSDYVTSQSVTLDTPTCVGAEIRYTIDGSDPTLTSPIYAAALTIAPPTTTVLKAIGIETGMPSSVLTETYAFPIKVSTDIDLEVTTDEAADLQMISCLTSGDCSTQVKNIGETITNGTITITSTIETAGEYNLYVKPQYFLSQMQTSTLSIGDNAVTFSTPFTAGDLNNDDVINSIDYGLFAGMFGDAGPGDFNRDGIVNTIDFAVFYHNYGDEGVYFTTLGNAEWTW